MENKVLLFDSNDVKIGETFIRRAKQLVKQQRAIWIDDNQSAIRFAAGMENMDVTDSDSKKNSQHNVLAATPSDNDTSAKPHKLPLPYWFKALVVMTGLIMLGIVFFVTWLDTISTDAMAFVNVTPIINASGTVWVQEGRVSVGGTSFRNVLIFRVPTDFEDTGYVAYSLHNLNGQFTILSGHLAQWGQPHSQNGMFHFYGDGELIRSFFVTQFETMPVTISVEGVEQLTIKFSNPTGVGMTTYSVVGATIR